MKKIELDKNKEREEELLAEARKIELDKMKEVLESFKRHPAHHYIVKFFSEYEKQFEEELQAIQFNDMKALFMLPLKEQRAKLVEMSKRELILTGVLSIIKRVKRKIL